jgi:hypothetical protein
VRALRQLPQLRRSSTQLRSPMAKRHLEAIPDALSTSDDGEPVSLPTTFCKAFPSSVGRGLWATRLRNSLDDAPLSPVQKPDLANSAVSNCFGLPRRISTCLELRLFSENGRCEVRETGIHPDFANPPRLYPPQILLMQPQRDHHARVSDLERDRRAPPHHLAVQNH